MSTLLGLLRLLWVFRWQMAAALALGFATIGSGIGLMGTAAYLIASAALQPSIADLQVAIVGVRFFGLSRGVFRYLERLVSHGLTLRVLGKLRVWFFRSLEPLVPAQTITMRSSDLLTRAVSDVESLQELFIRAVAPPIVAVLVAGGSGLVLGGYAWELAVVFGIGFTSAAVVMPVLSLLAGRTAAHRLRSVRTDLATALMDGIQGMSDLVAFGRGRSQQRLIERCSWTSAVLRARAARTEAAGAAGVVFATHATVWAVLFVAIAMVREGRFTGVDLAVVCLVAMASFEAAQSLPAAARGLSEQLEAANRIFAILDRRPLVDETVDAQSADGECLGNTIDFRGVTMTYPGNDLPVLSNLDLEIAAGSRVAVVGPSGAGKSTLAHLLLRFWDPSEGEIQLGHRSLQTIPLQKIRSTIGLLPQRTDLFAGTIRDNLLLAEPDAGQSDLDRVAAGAGLLRHIRAFPDGWDTWIGEHGMQLSGGQRQRLALARLMLCETPVVVLDEPTTGLDPITEKEVMASLIEVFGGRTTIVITHRLVDMDRFDEVVVLDHGRIVECGTHADLVGLGGLYRQLHDAQKLELGG